MYQPSPRLYHRDMNCVYKQTNMLGDSIERDSLQMYPDVWRLDSQTC